MNKVCLNCKENFEITDADKEFYKKLAVPHPSTCPSCRNELRMSHRNFWSLYSRKSDMSGKELVSMFPEESPYTVYSSEEWHGDNWDPLSFGIEFDSNISFFDQFKKLQLKVPRAALLHYLSENSSYCNLAFKSKSCYMVFGCVENEDCYYGHIVWKSKDCVDGLYLYECELCYECVDCVTCYNCNYSHECRNSRDLDFCFDCLGCSNCFGCAGLRQKEYYWCNKKLSKEEYKSRLEDYRKHANENVDKGMAYLSAERDKLIHPYYYGYQNEDVSGDHIYYSKNTQYSFDAKRCEDCKFLYTVERSKDMYDATFCAGGCELIYNCLTVTYSQNLVCCQRCQESYGLFYCDECTNCRDCFGCIGLKHKQYCILNKQYTKDEYEVLKNKIVEAMTSRGEYGEFFPKYVSPFDYKETIAYMYSHEYRG